jgi:glycosyltransferase involved in cell wall biosynthesis
MRVVHVLPFYEPATRFGGPVAQLASLCPLLARRGHRVSVVTTDLGQAAGWPRDRWIERDGPRVWYARTAPHHRVAPYWCPGVRAPLAAALADADVLHMTLGLTLVNAIARPLALAQRVPYLYTPQGSLCPTRLRSRALSKQMFVRLFERRVVRDASALQALTQKERDDLLGQGADPERIHVVPNGVPLAGPADPAETAAFRTRFAVPPEAGVVLYLGQLLRVKGVVPLIEAFARLGDPAVWLVLAGPDVDVGREARELAGRLGVAERVVFTGHLDGALKRGAFDAADVFVLPSFSEGLPLAVLEAASRARAVVVSDACNVPEVAEYEAGLVVTPEAGALAGALDVVLADAAARQRMARNAERMVRERFTLDAVADGLERIYDGMRRR